MRKKEIISYLGKIKKGNDEQNAIIFGHAILIYSQLIKKFPLLPVMLEAKDDGDVGELDILVI